MLDDEKARIRALARARRRARRAAEAEFPLARLFTSPRSLSKPGLLSEPGDRPLARSFTDSDASGPARSFTDTTSASLDATGAPVRPFTGSPHTHSTARSASQTAEAEDLRRHWFDLLAALGIGRDSATDAPLPYLPALFLPTPLEPDIRLVLSDSPRRLLPALVDRDGRPLSGPAWTLEAETSDRSDESPAEEVPHRRAEHVLGPEALAAADVVLIAALAVDAAGTRVGQGGGWYDRALVHARPGVPIVAAIFDDEWSDRPLPRLPHDRPVDAVVSPGGFRLLGANH